MSKPAIAVVGALGVIALAVLLGAFVLRDKPPQPSPVEEQETVAATPPAPRLDAARAKLVLPSPPAPVAPPKQRQATAKDTLMNAASLMAKLHELAATDPPLSLQLAREAVARFPDSPDAPEFEWNVVKALANMDRYKEAEEEARVMVKKYPDSSFSADVDRHLLNHPPNPQKPSE